MGVIALPVADEQLVRDFLAAQPEFTALGASIGSELPKDWAPPRVRLNRTGGNLTPPGRLDAPRQYLECYGATKADALGLVSTVRALLSDATGRIVGVHPRGTVTRCVEVSGPAWIPDPVGGPAGSVPRYVLVIALTTHPNT